MTEKEPILKSAARNPKNDATSLTLGVELIQFIRAHPEINWSAVCRNAIRVVKEKLEKENHV